MTARAHYVEHIIKDITVGFTNTGDPSLLPDPPLKTQNGRDWCIALKSPRDISLAPREELELLLNIWIHLPRGWKAILYPWRGLENTRVGVATSEYTCENQDQNELSLKVMNFSSRRGHRFLRGEYIAEARIYKGTLAEKIVEIQAGASNMDVFTGFFGVANPGTPKPSRDQ